MKQERGRQRGNDSEARDKILDAALRVFGEAGFKGATTRRIASKAGVNEVTIFRQFKSKRGLYNAVVAERSPLMRIKGAVLLEPKRSMDDLLLENMKTVLGILRANRHMYMVMLGEVWRQPGGRTSIYSQPIQQGIEFLAAFIQSQIDAGRLRRVDPRTAARAWMGTIQFYFMTTDLIGRRSVSESEEERTLRGFVDLFLDGARAEGGARSG